MTALLRDLPLDARNSEWLQQVGPRHLPAVRRYMVAGRLWQERPTTEIQIHIASKMIRRWNRSPADSDLLLFVRSRDRGVVESQSPHKRQAQAGAVEVEAEVQAEDVYLDAFL